MDTFSPRPVPLKDLLRFQIGLMRSACGKWSQEWQDLWRDLHCRTNGYVTDYVSGLVRLFRRKPAFQPTSGLIGPMTEERAARLVAEVNETGLSLVQQPIDSAIVSSVAAFANSTPSMPYPQADGLPERAVFSATNPLAPTFWHDAQAFMANEAMQKIICDPSLIAVAAEYLQVDPILASVAMWHSAPHPSGPSSAGAQKYHFDLAYPKWLCVFIYLTDVDPSTGPHIFVKGSHKRDRAGLKLRNPGIDRVPDEAVQSTYGKEQFTEICGPAGTLFFADTRAFHKGSHPQRGERLMLNLIYANSQVTMPAAPCPFTPFDREAVRAIEARYPRYFDTYRPRGEQSVYFRSVQ